MDDIAGVRQALADKIKDGVDFQFAQVSPWKLNNPTTPCAYILLHEEDWPDGNHTRDETLNFGVYVLIAKNSDLASQQALDPLIGSTGPQSIKAALEAPDEDDSKVTLGGLIADLLVVKCQPDRLFPTPSTTDPHSTSFGAVWTVLAYSKPD